MISDVYTFSKTKPLGAPDTIPLGAPDTMPLGAPDTKPLGAPDTMLKNRETITMKLLYIPNEPEML